MPVLMKMYWEGARPEQYDALRKLVNWEVDVPRGGLFHVAAFDEHGLHVTDIWESAEDFQNFVNTRLMPGVEQLGIPGEPKVEIYPTHALFTPGYKPLFTPHTTERERGR